MKPLHNSLKRFFVSVALILPLAASSQTVQITALNFPSPNATSCTNTFLDVDVTLGCSNAVHLGNSVSVSGFTVTVDIDYSLGPICLPAITTVTHNVNLGMLPAGNYTVNVNGVLNGSGLSNMGTTLAVTSCCPASPAFTASADSICPGDSVYFANNSTGAISQEWYENGALADTSLNHGRRFQMPGNYDIRLVVTDGTCSDSITKTIVVHQVNVDLGNDTTLCLGSSLLLEAGSDYDSLLWSDMSTDTALLISTAGLYYVTAYKYGCESVDSIAVNASTPVDLGKDTTVCIGDTLTLDAFQAGASYQWHDMSTNPTFDATLPGNYYVTVTDANGCVSLDSISVLFDTCHTNISEASLHRNLHVYPVPARDQLQLQLNTQESSTYKIDLLDLTGRVVLQWRIHLGEGIAKSLDISGLESGSYLLNITGDEGRLSRPILVK